MFFASWDSGEILLHLPPGRTVQYDDCRTRYHSKCLGFGNFGFYLKDIVELWQSRAEVAE